jgi:hypothetical protein
MHSKNHIQFFSGLNKEAIALLPKVLKEKENGDKENHRKESQVDWSDPNNVRPIRRGQQDRTEPRAKAISKSQAASITPQPKHNIFPERH